MLVLSERMYKRKAPLVRFRRVLLTFTLGLTLQSSEKPAQVVVKLEACEFLRQSLYYKEEKAVL